MIHDIQHHSALATILYVQTTKPKDAKMILRMYQVINHFSSSTVDNIW